MCVQRSLGLCSLALLTPLVSCALLAHFFIAQRRQRTSDLFDLIAGEFLDELFAELGRPQCIMSLFRVGRQQRDQDAGQGSKLVLCRWLEQRQRRKINGLGGIGRVSNNDGFGFASVIAAVQVDVVKEVLCVLEIRVLFRSS